MFDSILAQSLTLPTFLIYTGVSLALGVVLTLASSFRARTSRWRRSRKSYKRPKHFKKPPPYSSSWATRRGCASSGCCATTGPA